MIHADNIRSHWLSIFTQFPDEDNRKPMIKLRAISRTKKRYLRWFSRLGSLFYTA
ncbi:MAG: hypothetical protein JWM11_5340 [Planctomycetaceae bacterium]|nr:hypothetical protein [Planctomycetaceae bacterium]